MKASGHSIPNDLMSQLKAFHARNHLVCIASCRWKCAASRFLCPPGHLQALESFLCSVPKAAARSELSWWGWASQVAEMPHPTSRPFFHSSCLSEPHSDSTFSASHPQPQAPPLLQKAPAVKGCSVNKPKAEHGSKPCQLCNRCEQNGPAEQGRRMKVQRGFHASFPRQPQSFQLSSPELTRSNTKC